LHDLQDGLLRTAIVLVDAYLARRGWPVSHNGSLSMRSWRSKSGQVRETRKMIRSFVVGLFLLLGGIAAPLLAQEGAWLGTELSSVTSATYDAANDKSSSYSGAKVEMRHWQQSGCQRRIESR
jgi:hypothetical protein